MSNMETKNLEAELAESPFDDLVLFADYLEHAPEEQFQAALARKVAADYVRAAFIMSFDFSNDMAGLHEWIRNAKCSYRKRLNDECRRAIFRTESERTHRFWAGEGRAPE